VAVAVAVAVATAVENRSFDILRLSAEYRTWQRGVQVSVLMADFLNR
jgi:hypothetical protein